MDTSKHGLWPHSLLLMMPAGQLWLAGASHLLTLVAWKVPDGWPQQRVPLCLHWPRRLYIGQCKSFHTFPAAEGMTAGKIRSLFKCPQPWVWYLAMTSGMWQGSSVQSVVHQAGQTGNQHPRSVLLALGSCTCWRLSRSGNLHLPLHSVLLALGSHTCRLSGRPECRLVFLYLPPNGSHSNWRLGCSGTPLARNLSAPYCHSSLLRLDCPGGTHAALSDIAAALVAHMRVLFLVSSSCKSTILPWHYIYINRYPSVTRTCILPITMYIWHMVSWTAARNQS